MGAVSRENGGAGGWREPHGGLNTSGRREENYRAPACFGEGQPTFDHIMENLRAVIDAVPIRISIRINIDSRNRSPVPRALPVELGARSAGTTDRNEMLRNQPGYD